jgi:hypothetical protein
MKPTAFTTTLSRASLCLQAGYGLSLTDAAGAELTTRTGRVWLTMEGDARDVNLKAGDAYTIERNGLTLVSALEPSVVQVRMPGRSAKLRAWLEQAWALLVRGAEIRARARLVRGIRFP